MGGSIFALILVEALVEGADTYVNQDVACGRRDALMMNSASQGVTVRSCISWIRRGGPIGCAIRNIEVVSISVNYCVGVVQVEAPGGRYGNQNHISLEIVSVNFIH